MILGVWVVFAWMVFVALTAVVSIVWGWKHGLQPDSSNTGIRNQMIIPWDH